MTKSKCNIFVIVDASLMIAVNDEKMERDPNVLSCVENREDKESFVYGEL